jgi:hypothetical protein
VALAIAPGRDPEETPEDRIFGTVAMILAGVVALAFAIWLVWVYLL